MKTYSTSQRLKQIMSTRNLRQVDILLAAEPYCKEHGLQLKKNDLSQYVSGKVEPGKEKLTILASTLGVSEAWLMGYDVPVSPTALNDADRRDIARDLERIMANLENEDTLMFDGDPLSDEAKESIKSAMQLGLELAKVKNKERFTPKKYRKV